MNFFQRAVLCCMALFISTSVQSIDLNERDTTLIAGATAIVVGTAVYLTYRESNASIIARAENIVRSYRDRVEQSLNLFNAHKRMDISSVKVGELRGEMLYLDDQLMCVLDELESRYFSWLTPWNWTNRMQEACSHVRAFEFQVKLLILVLSVQQAQEFINDIAVRVDEMILNLNDEDSFCIALKDNSLFLKTDLQKAVACAPNLLQLLKARAFLHESVLGLSYEATVITTEYMLRDLIQKMDLLRIVFQYMSCFSSNTEEDLMRAARIICGQQSSYPVMYTVDRLGDEIKRINKLTVYIPSKEVCLNMLDKLRMRLMESRQHTLERQAYECYLQQQRLAAAAEAQARAVKAHAAAAFAQANALQQQAWAQQRQAAALEESNRIERQKNKY